MGDMNTGSHGHIAAAPELTAMPLVGRAPFDRMMVMATSPTFHMV